MSHQYNNSVIKKFLFKKIIFLPRCQCLMPVILATQEIEIRRIAVRSQPGQIVPRDPILKKPFTIIGLYKMKALSSSPSTGGKKKKIMF
jgi:hypothetical protein